MQKWDTRTLELEPHHPQVLRSDEETRGIAIELPSGEELQEHQVHERTYLLVADGEIEITQDGEAIQCGPGFLSHFEPAERMIDLGGRRNRIENHVSLGKGQIAGGGNAEEVVVKSVNNNAAGLPISFTADFLQPHCSPRAFEAEGAEENLHFQVREFPGAGWRDDRGDGHVAAAGGVPNWRHAHRDARV